MDPQSVQSPVLPVQGTPQPIVEQPSIPEQQVNLPQEPHEVPKKKSGFLAFVIFILVITGLAAFSYWVYLSYFSPIKVDPIIQVTPSASPDPTANWETYTNSYWGVSFKYPTDKLKICPNYTLDVDGVLMWTTDFTCVKEHDGYYQVGLIGYAPGKYVESVKPYSTGETMIGGMKATKKVYVYSATDGPLASLNQSVDIVIDLPKGTLVFQQLGNNANDQMLFDQMTSTFMFTNASPTPIN